MVEEKKILNEEQLQAIRHGEGPLLIIAVAGIEKGFCDYFRRQ